MEYRTKRNKWVHAAVWLAIFALYFNMIYYFSTALKAIVIASYNVGSLLLIFYAIAQYVFPKYYHKKGIYFTISFGMIIILTTIVVCGEKYYMTLFEDSHTPPFVFHYMRFFTQLTLSFFVATSMSLMERANMLTEREKLLNEEKFDTELKLLKAQINPHFIFNALNNIYSLTYMQKTNAPDSVLKLSEMLRYVFYDCNKDKVSLQAEIAYINNFIAFQDMKSELKQNINLDVDVENETVEVAPMLFIPFIENAFKYSDIEDDENAFVNIKVNSSNNKLAFNIKNSIPQKGKTLSGSGTGIKNVKHRLDIIYKDHYTFDITEDANTFNVSLNIDLA